MCVAVFSPRKHRSQGTSPTFSATTVGTTSKGKRAIRSLGPILRVIDVDAGSGPTSVRLWIGTEVHVCAQFKPPPSVSRTRLWLGLRAKWGRPHHGSNLSGRMCPVEKGISERSNRKLNGGRITRSSVLEKVPSDHKDRFRGGNADFQDSK